MALDGKSSNEIMKQDEHLESESIPKPTGKPVGMQNNKEEGDFEKKTTIKESQSKKEGKEKRITLTTGEAALGDLSTIEDDEDQHTERVEDESGIDAHSPDLTSRGPVFDDEEDENDEAMKAGADRGVVLPFPVRRPNAPQPASRDYDSDGYEKDRSRAGKGFEEGGVPDEELEVEHPFNK